MCNFFNFLFNKPENQEPEASEPEEIEVVPDEGVIEEEESVEEEPVVEEQEEPVLSSPSYADADFVVLLDNGHAKSTAGKRSPLFEDGTRFFEYEFNRAVVARITKKLDVLGIKYHVLVPEVDVDIPLTTRANRANEYCKKYGKNKCIFISVHSNACGKGETWNCKEAQAGGWCIYTTRGVTKSDEYAKIFYNVAEEKLKPYGFKCRDGKYKTDQPSNEGPDYEENFTVIYKTWCPAILTENLFFTNRKECEWLLSDVGRDVIADIHVEGIKRIIEKL